MNTNDTNTHNTPTDTAPSDSTPDASLPTPDTRTPTPDAPDRLIPVTEAIRYRKRAQAAEQQVGTLEARLAELQSQLEQSQQTMAQLERRQKIDALLTDADAVDVEVARLLTESAVELMAEPDVALAIADLKRGKPYLFRQRTGGSAQSMSARSRENSSQSKTEAAQAAATSGDRRDLLHYLRLRRSNGLKIRA